jgi:hypothetical protein
MIYWVAKANALSFGVNWVELMPELCRFFGVIIRMYAEFGVPHHRPHFHAYYQDEAAVFGIDPIELIAGNLPRRQTRLVEAWADCTATNWLKIGDGSSRANQPLLFLRCDN